MSKVTTQQLRYALDRLHRAKRDEESRIRTSCMVETGHKPLTAVEFVKAVKSGKITLRSQAQLPSYTVTNYLTIHSMFDYEVLPAKKRDSKREADLLAAHHSKWNRILDRAVLGDAVELLNLVTEFSPA
jgi:hypothetical protein